MHFSQTSSHFFTALPRALLWTHWGEWDVLTACPPPPPLPPDSQLYIMCLQHVEKSTGFHCHFLKPLLLISSLNPLHIS